MKYVVKFNDKPIFVSNDEKEALDFAFNLHLKSNVTHEVNLVDDDFYINVVLLKRGAYD